MLSLQNSIQVGGPSSTLVTNAEGKLNQKINTGNKQGLGSQASNINQNEEDKNNCIKRAISSTSFSENKDGSEIQSSEPNARYYPTRTSFAPSGENLFEGNRKDSSGVRPTKTNCPALPEKTNHYSAGGQPSNNSPHTYHVIERKELTLSYANITKASLPKEPPPPPPPPHITTVEITTNATKPTPAPSIVDPVPQASTNNVPQSSEINVNITTSNNNRKRYDNIARSINNATRSQHSGTNNNNNRLNNPSFNSNGQPSVHSQPLGGALQHQHLQTPQLSQITQQAQPPQHLSNQPNRDGQPSTRNHQSYNNNNRRSYQYQSTSNYSQNQRQMGGGPRAASTLPTQHPQGPMVMPGKMYAQQQHDMQPQIYNPALGFAMNPQGMMIAAGQPGGGNFPQQPFHNQNMLHPQMILQQHQQHPQYLQQQMSGLANQLIMGAMYSPGMPMAAQQFQSPFQQQYMHHHQGAMPRPDVMQQQGGPRTQMMIPQQLHSINLQLHQMQQHFLLPQHQPQLSPMIPQPQHQQQQQQPQHQKLESQIISNQNYSTRPTYSQHPPPPSPSSSTITSTIATARSKIVIKAKDGKVINLAELAAKPSAATSTASLVPSAPLERDAAGEEWYPSWNKSRDSNSCYRTCELSDIYCGLGPEPIDKLIQLNCSHFMHADCLAGYVKGCVDESRRKLIPIVCPACDKCKTPCTCPYCSQLSEAERGGVHRIQESELKLLGSENLDDNMIARVAYTSVLICYQARGQKILHCTCDRSYAVDPDDRMHNCPCGRSVCVQCEREAHLGMTCEEANKEKDRIEFINTLNQSKSMFQCCPRCSQPWVTPMNCQHVDCEEKLEGCGMSFCFLCGAVREPILRHGNNFHRKQCDFFTECCDGKCLTTGKENCVFDKFLPNVCGQCKATGEVCKAPKDLTANDAVRGFKILGKLEVEADAKELRDMIGGVQEHK